MEDFMTLEQARGFLREAVETQGREFVYNPDGRGTCSYMSRTDCANDDPRALTGCLVGTALKLSGRSEKLLSELDAGEFDPGVHAIAGLCMLSSTAASYFDIAQMLQDNGSTWGEAFDKAEASVSNHV